MMIDVRSVYNKAYDDGQKSILRLLRDILEDAPQPGYSGLAKYYERSIEILLEVYSNDKEKKDTKQEKTASAASKS